VKKKSLNLYIDFLEKDRESKMKQILELNIEINALNQLNRENKKLIKQMAEELKECEE
jgi:hypothetical protein